MASMPSKPNQRTDSTRSGSQIYRPRDVDEVFACLEQAGPRSPISNADIEAATGVQGRTIRQIIADHSGVDHPVVCKAGASGFYLPQSYEDCEPTWRATERAIRSAQQRLEREKTWAAKNLERRQFGLFDDQPEPEDDEEL